MNKVLLELTVATTEQDCHEAAQALFRERAGKSVIFFYVLAGLLIFFALLILFFEPGWWLVSVGLLAVALYAFLQPGWLLPRQVRTAAARSFRQMPGAGQKTRLFFTETAILEEPMVGQDPPYLEINWPYPMIYEAVETPTHYIVRYDLQMSTLIRKEGLSPHEQEILTGILERHIGGRFQKTSLLN